MGTGLGRQYWGASIIGRGVAGQTVLGGEHRGVGAGRGLSTPRFIRHFLPPFSVRGRPAAGRLVCSTDPLITAASHQRPYQRTAQRPPQPASPGLVPNSQEGEDDPFTEGPCPGLAQPAAARQAGPALTSESPPQAALDGKGLEGTTCISPGRGWPCRAPSLSFLSVKCRDGHLENPFLWGLMAENEMLG